MRFASLTSAAILTLGLVSAPALCAQGAAGGQPRAGGMQARALQGITLTPGQQAKVDSIVAKTRAAMPQLTPGTPPSDADRQQMMKLSTESLAEVRNVLTPDQQAVFDKNVAAMKERMQRMGGGAGGAPPQGTPTKP
ncbi:MAG TPA: hypothetical protein VFV65_08730 [Gemmatimonadales bacterium]|nr:hypothetical protein [Gemmatimonadales bacterium]